MFDTEYREELERMGPDREQMERLKAALAEKGRRPRPLRRSAVIAAAVCAALAVTAAASSPTVRELLSEALGGFASVSQSVEGVSAVDQGIEVKVVSAMADSSKVVVYAEVRDLTGDRIKDANIRVDGGIRQKTPGERASTFGTKCVGYDPATKTALFRFMKGGSVPASVDTPLSLQVGRVQPGYISFRSTQPIPIALLTAQTRNSRTLDSGELVLEPGQTPAELAGAGQTPLSSLGFASDGRLHFLFRLSAEADPDTASILTNVYSKSGRDLNGDLQDVHFLLDGVNYIDLSFAAGAADLADIVLDEVYGRVITAEPVEGTWELPLELERLPELQMPLTGEIGKVKMKELILSPLSVSIVGDSGDTSCLLYNYPVAVTMADGSVLRPENQGSIWTAGTEDHGNAFDQWEFDTPADIEQVTGVAVGYWMIPIKDGAAGEGYWLTELP